MGEHTKPPVRGIDVGQVSIAIWQNEYVKDGQARTFFSASVAKNYTGKDGQAKSSNRFTRRELQDLSRAVQEALDYIEICEHRTWREEHVGAEHRGEGP